VLRWHPAATVWQATALHWVRRAAFWIDPLCEAPNLQQNEP